MNNSSFNLDGFMLVHMETKGMLHERRKILGLTQRKVAERANIPLQSYQQFESGKRDLYRASFSIACRVIEALEMDITEFYHGEYSFHEEIYNSPEGFRYKKTGKLVAEEPDEE